MLVYFGRQLRAQDHAFIKAVWQRWWMLTEAIEYGTFQPVPDNYTELVDWQFIHELREALLFEENNKT